MNVIQFQNRRNEPLQDKFLETWEDDDGNIQIRLIDNADALITRITISGGGVERLWHPGTDGDDDTPEVVIDKMKCVSGGRRS